MTTAIAIVLAALGGYFVGRVGASTALGAIMTAGAAVAGYFDTIVGWFGG